MRLLRKITVFAVVFSMIGLMPGQSAYQAAAAAFHAAPVTGDVSGGYNGASAAVKIGGTLGNTQLTPLQINNLSLTGTPALGTTPKVTVSNGLTATAIGINQIATSIDTVNSGAASVPAAANHTANRTADAVAQEQKGVVQTVLGALSRQLPDFSKMGSQSKSGADTDFMQRVGSFKAHEGDANLLPSGMVMGQMAAAHKGSGLSKSSHRGSSSKTPDSGEEVGPGNGPVDDQSSGGTDALGNPERRQSDGPDTAHDEFGGSDRGGDSGLFSVIPTLAFLGSLAMGNIVSAVATLAMIIPALILHEMGHAKAADMLGDKTARQQDRLSFSWKGLKSHIDPMFTLVVPLITMLTSGFIIGGAKPVPINQWNFKNPAKDMAKVALAGPAVNFALAIGTALVIAGLGLAGIGGLAMTLAVSFLSINVMLGVFNLLPIAPLDGSHVLRALLPAAAGAKLDAFYAKIGTVGQMVMVYLAAILGSGGLMWVISHLTGLLLGGAVAGISLATGFLPAMAAAGLLVGQMMKTSGPASIGSIPVASAEIQAGNPVDVIVILKDGARALTQDLHLANVNLNMPNSVEVYAETQRSLLSDIEAAGLGADVLAGYDATPIASYKRINAATIRVDAARAEEFKAMLRGQGHKVYDNGRRRIITPVTPNPEGVDPEARGTISMSENLQITKADKVQAEGRKRWGAPEMGFMGRLWAKLTGEQAPQPLIGVIDTGADVNHPQIKRLKALKNVTTGPTGDGNGHGTWVASMILNYAPWLRSLTAYKVFTDDGGASLDDILKALTMSGNDGNLVVSNSWGSDDGDPTSPDSLLVKKLAEEGHIMVFAAGNAGPGANTIGSPAIMHYKDAQTGAIRVISVAAADRTKKVAYFSSRGPGSEKTKTDPNYPHRPDWMGLGYNTDGAWPTNVGGADKVDPELGPIKAISGTSMSTPSIAGAIALLAMMFGVTETGAKLDAIVNAIASTLEKTGQSRDAEGEGFINIDAAYQALKATLKPVKTGFLARFFR